VLGLPVSVSNPHVRSFWLRSMLSC
jgi:hypothetical protein